MKKEYYKKADAIATRNGVNFNKGTLSGDNSRVYYGDINVIGHWPMSGEEDLVRKHYYLLPSPKKGEKLAGYRSRLISIMNDIGITDANIVIY